MIKDRLALQLYSVRDYAAADLFGVLEQVRAMGYSGVEFAGLYGYDPLAVKEKCAQLGLTPISAHVPLEELTEDLEERWTAMKNWAAAMWWCPICPRSTVPVPPVLKGLSNPSVPSVRQPTAGVWCCSITTMISNS